MKTPAAACLWLSLVAGAASSCSSARPCVPGQSVACVGAGGCPGGQVCNSGGAGYESCVCGSGSTDGGSGGGSGGGASGGGSGGSGGSGGGASDAGRLPDGGVRKPDVLFLIDKSGSMNFAADDTVSPCTSKCNTSGMPACASGCATRLQALKSAMSSFLALKGTGAWTAMAIYPTAVAGSGGSVDACGATTSADVRVPLAPNKTDLESDLKAAALAVDNQVQAIVVGGGTPTADSLKFLSTYAPLADPDPTVLREDYLVLVTDGLPNCNSNNPNTCTGTACKCTLAPATSCTPTAFCTQGCLDKDATVVQVGELRKKNIKTFIVGFGSETASGDGPDVLNAMAIAGGTRRTCPNGNDSECGGAVGSCDTGMKLCTVANYQATTSAELFTVLEQIFSKL